MNKPQFRIAALLAAGLAATCTAHAADLIVNQNYNGWAGVAVNASGSHAPALFNVKNVSAGDSFLAYCMEIGEPALSTAASYTASAFTGSANVQELYDRYYGTSITSKTNAIAFQLALWDLAGQAPLSSYTYVSDTAAQSTASTWVGAVVADANPVAHQYQLTLWSNGANQDVLQAAAVPEPATYALLLGGLGAVAMVARRRSGGEG